MIAHAIEFALVVYGLLGFVGRFIPDHDDESRNRP